MVLIGNKHPLLIVNYQFLTLDAPLFELIVRKSDYNITSIIKQFINYQPKRVHQVT